MSATALSVDRSGSYWPVARQAEHVWLDGQVRASLDQSVPQIGAPEAWSAGHTGAGATVAVLDTGIDASHPDLADAVAAAKNFTDSDTADDRDGHGTHVASTITGNGAASGGKYRGVAPDAMLLNGKVLDDNGGGYESGILAGMEWAAQSGADVINMSFGSFLPSDGTDPMSQAVNRITAETGTLFVIASGNNGPVPGWIGSPAAADAALTVGAVDKTDKLAAFSSRGPRWENGGIKPEITAPGVDIVAARATNGQLPDSDGDGYVSLSGTSMATPHVAGAAAIVAGQHPEWTGAQIKSALMGSAKPGAGQTVFQQGAGRVDLAKAASTTVFTTSGDLSFGLAQWPHGDDQAIMRELTYANTGSEPVTLDLTADIATPDGSAAPRGMFTITPETLVVPAGGQATATLRADTTVDGPDGYYEGTVTATGGGQPLAGEGNSRLLRDGVVVDEDPDPFGGWYEVGPERAKYTLRTAADRSAFARLSTKISAEWTFESAHTTELGSVPLLAARFAPPLDDHNAAPAGRRFTIPFYVQRNGTDGNARVNQPGVEVSYDDGRTWRPAKVTRDGSGWKATVDHPRGAEFVSLRSNVTDRDGNAQRLTIIRAYALK